MPPAAHTDSSLYVSCHPPPAGCGTAPDPPARRVDPKYLAAVFLFGRDPDGAVGDRNPQEVAGEVEAIDLLAEADVDLRKVLVAGGDPERVAIDGVGPSSLPPKGEAICLQNPPRLGVDLDEGGRIEVQNPEVASA